MRGSSFSSISGGSGRGIDAQTPGLLLRLLPALGVRQIQDLERVTWGWEGRARRSPGPLGGKRIERWARQGSSSWKGIDGLHPGGSGEFGGDRSRPVLCLSYTWEASPDSWGRGPQHKQEH